MQPDRAEDRTDPIVAFRRHWPEYLIEAAGLGLFMIVAGLVVTVLEHPASPLHRALPDPLLRRLLTGAAMGLTAICLIYSPWGRQSGAHLNPAVTLTFFRLGKIETADALFYVAAQFIGGAAGVVLVAAGLGELFTLPPVSSVATRPGEAGVAVAFLAETTIAFIMMSVILNATNRARLMPLAGIFGGSLVALFIGVEAPLSGMSMNPARSVASALPSGQWTGIWIYLLAPPLGMLLAAETYCRMRGIGAIICAKLNHNTHRRCIFRCGYRAAAMAGERHAAAHAVLPGASHGH